MRLGYFTMPVHPIHRNWAETLKEDREAIILDDKLGFYAAFTTWNLSSPDGMQFNGIANFVQMWNDPYFWNALGNMVFYLASVVVQYTIAFGLALLLNADIRGRKFFRVAFLLPFMLSPVAVSWMIGKSLMEPRFGPRRSSPSISS